MPAAPGQYLHKPERVVRSSEHPNFPLNVSEHVVRWRRFDTVALMSRTAGNRCNNNSFPPLFVALICCRPFSLLVYIFFTVVPLLLVLRRRVDSDVSVRVFSFHGVLSPCSSSLSAVLDSIGFERFVLFIEIFFYVSYFNVMFLFCNYHGCRWTAVVVVLLDDQSEHTLLVNLP